MRRITLTRQGYQNLKDQLTELKVRREKVIARVQRAREFGDLSENSEYDDARNEQSFIEGKIKEIEGMIRNAEISDLGVNNGGVVSLGSKITVEQDGKTEEFTLVGANESKPIEGKISIESPLGKALLGKKVGETAKFNTPGGVVEYKIIKIN